LGPWEILIVVVIILLIFGGRLIPRIGSSLGRSIVGLKKGLKEGEEGFKAELKQAEAVEAEPEDKAKVTASAPEKTEQS
jgi:sec-independent protein translocase protein TatA